jgi:hypothetical protein
MKSFSPVSTALIALAILGAGRAQAQGDTGETLEELKAALVAAEGRNEDLGRENHVLANANRVLGESLAGANEAADGYRESYKESRLQLEALGRSSVDSQKNGMQQRLVKAVTDLRIAEEHSQKLAEEMIRFSEAVTRYLKKTENTSAKSRLEIEEALRSADACLGLAFPAELEESGGTDGARVISFKQDYSGLIVCNVGKDHGMRPGMPLRIQRKDRIVGKALIVETRERICGAVLRELTVPDDEIRVGDFVFIDPVEPK